MNPRLLDIISSGEWDRQVERYLASEASRRRFLQQSGRGLLGAVVSLGVLWPLSGCRRAPGTARDQLIFISEEKEIAMGVESFRQLLKTAPLVTDPAITGFVNRVGKRIARVANKPEYNWEFVVIREDSMVNAFALPGGKVAVFTGILPVTKDESGLATVMGHEIAHALQRHGAERMSRSILESIAQLGAMGAAASGAVDPAAAQGLLSAYGVGVSLPFNRKQESEADFVGLRLMAKAGYDPHEAVSFWERMSGCPRKTIGKLCFRSNAAIPEFLSTHPSDITRINQIEAWLPDAMRYYRPVDAPASAPAASHGLRATGGEPLVDSKTVGEK